jgi:hypothetical protein
MRWKGEDKKDLLQTVQREVGTFYILHLKIRSQQINVVDELATHTEKLMPV